MKKILFVTALFLYTFSSLSQNAFDDALYGVRGGMNISNLNFDPEPTVKNQHRNGFVFGFFGEFELSDYVLMMTEIQFSSEGAKAESLQLDYIQSPILFKYKISDRVLVGAGPLFGVKIHEDNDGFKNFHLSGILGAEFMMFGDFFLDARFSYGFTNKADKDIGFKIRQSNIQIGFGYKI